MKSYMKMMSVLVLIFMVSVAGCAGLGYMVGGDIQTFQGRESIILPVPKSNILDIVAEVGKSLGYSVSGLDREAGTISLSSGTSILTQAMIGKMNQSTLSVSLGEGGKKLDIGVSLMGNFGTGGQEAATNLVGDFKAKLLQKIGQ